MAGTFNGNFAKLVPKNYIALRLFSATNVYVEKDSTFHLRFIGHNRVDSIHDAALAEPLESSTDYDTYLDTDTDDKDSGAEDPGHFILSFNKELHPEIPNLGWRAGRGSGKSPTNRGVDLLLARPGDNRSKSIASVHMILRFHPRSGFLMLRGGSQKASVEYKVNGTWEKLGFNEEYLLHRPSTTIRLGLCEYDLEYTIGPKDRDEYLLKRNGFLELILPNELPHQASRMIPGGSCIARGRYLELETRGSGGFGWITQGVDTRTGEYVAIKELRIEPRTKAEASAEAQMGARFLVRRWYEMIERLCEFPNKRQDKRGLLPTIGTVCEHGNIDICCDLERFFIVMPYAVSDFTSKFWTDPNLPFVTRLSLLREPLEGIKTLHSMGIMHRDIRAKNTLVLSIDPPRASLCDYGKAIEAHQSSVTTIGPVYTCAPEVWTVARDGPYTSKVDMWAYGLEIAEILGYAAPNNSRITHGRHSSMLKWLSTHSEKVIEDKHIADLATKLLAWRSKDRPSAEEALEHECWLPVTQSGGDAASSRHRDLAEVPQAKRIQLPASSLRQKSTDQNQLATQEFSPETLLFLRKG